MISKNIRESITPFVDTVTKDVLGNIIAHKKGLGKKLMLIAHADEVRLMITAIDNDGFLRIKPSGAIDASILPARKIKIEHDGKFITGIIGKRPYHLQRPENEVAKVTFDDLWVDIGAKNKEEALEIVQIGDYAYYDTVVEEMPNGLICGKALDDNAGLEVILHVAEAIKNMDVPWDVYFVASTQEEIGGRGAIVAAQTIRPDYCIAIDVTHATDYPTINPLQYGDIKIGTGCVLTKGTNVDDELFYKLKRVATENNIPFQIEANPYPTGTDANGIQITNGGVRTAVISIPCRYMHTPYEIVSEEDILALTKLLSTYIITTMKNGVSPKAISE